MQKVERQPRIIWWNVTGDKAHGLQLPGRVWHGGTQQLGEGGSWDHLLGRLHASADRRLCATVARTTAQHTPGPAASVQRHARAQTGTRRGCACHRVHCALRRGKYIKPVNWLCGEIWTSLGQLEWTFSFLTTYQSGLCRCFFNIYLDWRQICAFPQLCLVDVR